ncbi:MAG: type VII secretion protein EssC [Eubacterium sp.]
MIASLLNKNKIVSITLPEKIKGQYSLISDFGIKVSIEGIDEKWTLKAGKQVVISDNKQEVDSCEIKEMNIYNLRSKKSHEKCFVFVEPTTNDRIEFKKYLFKNDITLNIGRKSNNSIVISNNYVSSNHATLSFSKSKWSIIDNDSSNGTFVNGNKIKSSTLNYGDIIYIMGTVIIVGNSMLAINNPDQSVSINANNLFDFIPQVIDNSDDEFDFDEIEEDIFFRSPRFKRDIEKAIFKIDAPPQSQTGDEMPIMMSIGPSMTMGMASMATGIYGLCQDPPNYISLVTCGCMLLGTVMWPIISKQYEKKKKKQKEELRQHKYKEYLERIKTSFADECAKQKEIYLENNVNIKECENRILNVSRDLWDRSFGQNDFLSLNVGKGSVKMLADIDYPERKFEIERDDLEEQLLDICEAPHLINDVPINVSLFDNKVTGVIGSRNDSLKFANGLILQLATMYSYDEVKFVFLYDDKEDDELKYVKWLPHIWNNDKSLRFLAKNFDDIKLISSYLDLEFESRKEMKEEDLEDTDPYYIIFAFDKQLSLRTDVIKKIYENKKNLHFSVISFFDELKNLPKECSNVIELNGNIGKIYDKNDVSGKIVEFAPDIYVNNNLEELSVCLSNIKLNMGDDAYILPKMITFLEMYGVGKIEHLNILNRWKENDPTKTLEAQVGVDTIGDPFKLDLHEKFHGPHGLIAGMTGSGKSEFIMTYILSLAINYHPDEVSFVLIDYKGGGMAKAFEKLPHIAGIITNLDGSAINRSLISIQSELRRRQGIFAEASKSSGISNIDIYKYQKMYREGTVTEPLQHLFIISDEFAELKTQQPEFMTQLVSAARIGRSLGVHLILATQKPSGVVDDQIWSNAKFKACLKVQDKADSMDMLKRPEAAELQDTGRFYLQVGYNEMFKLGQSAWSGAPYYPSDKTEQQIDDSIEVVDNVGRVIANAKMDKKKSIEKPKKQIDAITEYLSEIAQQESISVRPLWLEPIPSKIFVDELIKKYKYQKNSGSIEAVIGEYDDPMNQKQELLILSFSKGGNTAIYGSAGNGKTTFLNTMMYSLMNTYTPEELNIFILDFASETMTAFSKAPHVGDVVLSHEKEKVTNLIKLLLGQIQTRKKMLADYGGDINLYNNSSDNKIPSIVVAINNYAAFSEMYEDFEGEMLNITREGTKYGIYFVLTATGTNEIRFRMLQNIGQSFVLQLTDETDYAAVLGKTDGLTPSKFKGRGLCKIDEIYEFQTAFAFNSDNQFAAIRKFCSKLKDNSKSKARSIPVLPEAVDIEFIEPYVSENSLSIPIGVETETLEVNIFDFSKNYLSFIQSENKEYDVFISALAKITSSISNIDTTIIDSSNSIKDCGNAKYIANKKLIATTVENLFEIVLERHNAIKDAEEDDKSIPTYPLLLFIISSITDLKEQLTEEQIEKLNLILEKGSTKLNVFIVIAETSKNVSSYNFEKWYKLNASQSDGIWIGNGVADQYYLKLNKTTSEMNEEISAEYGYSINFGKANKIKLLSPGEEE